MKRLKSKPALKTQSVMIDTLSHEGRGVARIDGKTTFIQGALPDEAVTFQYTKIKKDFDEGIVISIEKQAFCRVEPKCPHYTLCGGCSLQHMSTAQQIQYKEDQLMDLFARYAHTQPETILPALVGPFWNYRNKARLSVRYVEKKQSALVGFRERNNPRYITEINQCPILHPQVDKDIGALKELINTLDDKHSIAQIEVAAGEDEIALIFRNLNPLSSTDLKRIENFAKDSHYKIFLQAGGVESISCFYPPKASPYLTYSLPAYNLQFDFHPIDFTQINTTINQMMISKAIKLMELNSEDVVLDLFCGLGNFSLPMSKFCAKVIGVEGTETMVERAYHNANRNQLKNLEFYTANLDDPLAVGQLAKWSANKLLLDPPRLGAFEIIKHIEFINPDRIVYVSCNPITLARDTELLVNHKGYTLIKAGVMDMFPQTAHVESIALFVKKG